MTNLQALNMQANISFLPQIKAQNHCSVDSSRFLWWLKEVENFAHFTFNRLLCKLVQRLKTEKKNYLTCRVLCLAT